MAVSERWGEVVIACARLVIWGASDQCRVNYPILKQLGCQIEALAVGVPAKVIRENLK